MTSDAAKSANEKWLQKTVSWNVKISHESHPVEAQKLEKLKQEKGLVAELFRSYLKDLKEKDIEKALKAIHYEGSHNEIK